MNVNSIQSSEQVSEQYKIRAKRQEQSAQQVQESQQAEQTQQLQQAQQVQAQKAQEVDTYDKENPVGVQAEGVYSVSYDEDGEMTVKYSQPATKSEDTGSAPSAKSESSQQASAGASSVTSTSSDDDDELEELQQQRDALRLQLNRETDEAVKAQLRVQLQSIETQIALKQSGIDA